MIFEKIGLLVPTILIPNKSIDMSKWAVVACDQYTSQPEYWEGVSKQTKNSPSTFNLIYPEVYLEEKDKEKRIKRINEAMDMYLKSNVFDSFKGFMLVDRKTSHANSRKGLIVALDLEAYDYTKGSSTLIRATEGTIVDRLPPRIKVRENAKIELPHIMILIDDPQKTVIEPHFSNRLECAYDFELMNNSGHIKGYKITSKAIIKSIADALLVLSSKKVFDSKYNIMGKSPLLYAMGDGNHSLATAKACWEQKKKNGTKADDPARFALVELVNIHDEGLQFEPIHRALFNVNPDNLLKEMESFFKGQGFSFKRCKTKKEMDSVFNSSKVQRVKVFFEGGYGVIELSKPKLNLDVASLQSFIDTYLKNNASSKIDYLHGDDITISIGQKKRNIGFLLGAMQKSDLFKTVILDGALPRKTFSMGEADEKRFYLEARKIINQ